MKTMTATEILRDAVERYHQDRDEELLEAEVYFFFKSNGKVDDPWYARNADLVDALLPLMRKWSRKISYDSDGCTSYGRAVLNNQIAQVEQAREGTRQTTINNMGFVIGRYVPHEIPEEVAREELSEAAQLTGLPDYEIERTVDRSISDGMKNPKFPE